MKAVAFPSRPWSLPALAILLTLAGCAPQPIKPVDSWDTHRDRLTALDTWQISGRMAVRLPDDSNSARLRWHQQQDQFRIDLSGPFGQGRTVIRGQPGQVTLTQGSDEPLEASSAEELIWQATGWLIPVDQLLYWVRGIPAPDSVPTRMTTNAAGLVAELEQSGWHLHYSNYTLIDDFWHLPQRIVASRDSIRLTLVIHEWSPLSGSH